MRVRNDWKKWLLPPPEQQELTHNISSQGPPEITINSLPPHFQRLGFEGSNSNSNLPLQGEASISRSTSGDLTEHVQLTGLHVSADPGQVMGPVDVGRALIMSDSF
jgi:hypothetical protein